MRAYIYIYIYIYIYVCKDSVEADTTALANCQFLA